MRRLAVVLFWSSLVVAGGAVAAKPPVIVQEGKLGQDWKVADGVQLAAPGYPSSGQEKANVCINLGYAVDEDGSVKDMVVLKSWGEGADGMPIPEEGIKPFAQASALAVSSWRFAPKGHVTDPARTVTSTTLAFVNGKSQGEVRGHCAIEDLAVFLDENKAKFKRGESMRATDLDAIYRGLNRQERINNANRTIGPGAR